MEVSPSSEGRYDGDYGEPAKRRKTFHGYPCPKCGTGVGFNAKVCKKCGSTVGKTAREASQASPKPTPTKLRSPKVEPANAASNSTRAAPRVLIVSPKTPKASLAPTSSPPDSPLAQPVVPPAQLSLAARSPRSPRLKAKPTISPNKSDILDSMSPLEAFGISELRAHVTALRQENVAKPLRNLLHRLWNHPANKGLFNTAVDVQVLPGYTKAVDKVMDLSVIKTRLQKLSYDDPEDFAADVHLVFQNARAYYAPTHHIHVAAEQMMNDFEDELDKATKRIDRDDTRRSEHFCTLCHGHECTLCGAKCIKHEPPILYCHGTCDQRVRVGARYYITRDGSRLWCQRCYAGLPSVIPNSGENLNHQRRAAGSLPPQLMGGFAPMVEETPEQPEPENNEEIKDEPDEAAAGEGESSTKKKRVLKRDLLKRRFDEEVAEPWVQCDACQHWVHQLCVMYNTASSFTGDESVPFYCPLCKLRGSQRGGKGNNGGVSIPPVPPTGGATKMWCAAALPENHMSKFIQERVRKRLKDLGEPKAAPSVVVRIVSTNEKTTDPSEMLRKYFGPPTPEQLIDQGKMDDNGNVKDVPLSKRYEMPAGEPVPGEMPYRSKTLLLFQRLDGIDVCLFAMYVSEYGKDCPGPNKRHVYVAYLDSVEYFRPRTHRTAVYHEVLIAYLEYAKQRGFVSAHIWACPPLRGNHFIFWSHPAHQRTPSRERLVSWYLAMLTRAQELGTVSSVTNLYSAYFKGASTLKEGGAGKKVAKGKPAAGSKAAAGALPAAPAAAAPPPDSCSQSVANGPEGADDAASAANSGGTAADSVADGAASQLCAFDESQRAQLGGNQKHAIVNTTGCNNCLNRPFRCPPIFEGDYWPEEASRLERETRKRKGLGVADREHLPVKEQCEGLVAQLMNHPSAYPFNAPVDAKALNIPDYYKVVTRPMDLGSVKAGIRNLDYTTVQQFVDDVRQVWANANAYNPPRHPITAMATTLSSLFEKELRGMFSCWAQAGVSKRGLNTRLDGQSVMDGMLDSDDDVDGADPEDDVVLVSEVVNSPRDTALKDGFYGGLGNDVALWGNNPAAAAAAAPPIAGTARRGTGRGNSSTKKKGRKKKKAAEPKDKEPEIKQKYHSIVTYTANSVQCMRDELLVARLHPCCTSCGEYFVEGYRWHDPESRNDYCAECKQQIEEHLVPHKVTVADTSDPDEALSRNGFVDSRHTFLEVCQFRHYQFDTLRNAKHSSAQIIHHLHRPTSVPIEDELKQAHRELHQLNAPQDLFELPLPHR